MQRAAREPQLKRAIEFAERLIDRGFVNFEAHAECSGFYREDGDEPKAIFHLQVATALAGSILGTGDGKTTETAFEVISDREEYAVLASLGFPYAGSDVLSNSRITYGGHNYDKWSVRKPKTNEVVDVFFNTDYFSPTKSRAQP